MPWSTVTESEVLQELSPSENTALENVHISGGTLAGILSRAINAARGAVLSGGGTLGAAGTVPDSLKSDVIAIARWRFLTSISQLKALQTEERKDLYRDAEEKLKLVASGDYQVEDPGTSDQATSGPGPSMTARTTTFDLESQDGL